MSALMRPMVAKVKQKLLIIELEASRGVEMGYVGLRWAGDFLTSVTVMMGFLTDLMIAS